MAGGGVGFFLGTDISTPTLGAIDSFSAGTFTVAGGYSGGKFGELIFDKGERLFYVR
jgi:hypothetical protein